MKKTGQANLHEGESVWTESELCDPHEVDGKGGRVRAMFGAIAHRYDVNNHIHSLWLDRYWRSVAVGLCGIGSGDVVVDVACGTGDLAMFAAHRGAKRVVGVDFVHEMVCIAGRKSDSGDEGGVPVNFVEGDAMRLPLGDESVDVVMIGFGLRNIAEPAAAVREFARVLARGGRLMILEFSRPKNWIVSSVYGFYFNHVMPRTAAWISGDKSNAYRYLPQSVNTFGDGDYMAELIENAGMRMCLRKRMTMGVVTVYLAEQEV